MKKMNNDDVPEITETEVGLIIALVMCAVGIMIGIKYLITGTI